MKKRRYFLPLAAGVLALVVTGGAIFAQTSRSEDGINSNSGTSTGGLAGQIRSFNQRESGRIDLSHGNAPNQSMMSRVAEILNIEESVLQNAFDQAIRGKQDDSMGNRVEHLVIDEKLTQVQADEILAWFDSRPDAAAKLNYLLLRGGEAAEHRLYHMVQRDLISQEEADAIRVWLDIMPQTYQDLSEHRFHRSSYSKSWGMNRMGFLGQRFGREGLAGRDFRRGGMWGHMKEGAHGLE